MKQTLMVGLSVSLNTDWVEDQKMMKDNLIDESNCKQVQWQISQDYYMDGSKFDDYSISPKIRQILLQWGYELTEKDFFIDLIN